MEVGLLPIFRFFLGTRLIFNVFEMMDASLTFTMKPLWGHALISFASILCLLVYLLSPFLQKRLRRLYLPIALAYSAVIPVIEQYLLLRQGGLSPDGLSRNLFAILIVPLFLTAWQYGFRATILFCIGSAVTQGLLLWTSSHPMMFILEAVAGRTLVLMMVGFMVDRLMKIQRQQRAAIEAAHQTLIAYSATLEKLAVSHERNRMARELHDILAHTLSGLAVQLDSIAALWTNIPAKANGMIKQALATVRSGLTDVRRALHALRAEPLEDLGLPLAIRALAEDAARRGTLGLTMDITDEINKLPSDVEHCFYRTAQEALENSLRHANAQHLSVSFQETVSGLILTMTDDGHGLDPHLLSEQSEHLGLIGMRERALMIGATLTIDSVVGQGTTIQLTWRSAS